MAAPREKEQMLPAVTLVIMAALFGMTYISARIALQGLGVFQLIFLRYLLAFGILTALFWKSRERFQVRRKDWSSFALLAAIEPVGYFVLETLGVSYTSPASVSLIIATVPLFTLILAAFILGEKPGWRARAGVVISFAGVCLMVLQQQPGTLAPRPLLGNLLTVGAACAAGLYNCLARRLSFRYPPLTITYYQTAVATVVFLPLAIWDSFAHPQFFLNGIIVGNVVFLAVGCSIFAYYLLNRSLSQFGAARVGVFSNLIPLFTIAASYVVYGEALQPLQYAWAALIILGIYLTFSHESRREAPIRSPLHPLTTGERV